MARLKPKKPKYGPEEEAFVNAIGRHYAPPPDRDVTKPEPTEPELDPDDLDLARLAYADWLAEHDRPVESAEQRALAGTVGMYYRLYHVPLKAWLGPVCTTLADFRREWSAERDDDAKVLRVDSFRLATADDLEFVSPGRWVPHRQTLPWLLPHDGSYSPGEPYTYDDGSVYHGGRIRYGLPYAELEVVVMALVPVKVGTEAFESSLTRQQVRGKQSKDEYPDWPSDAYTRPPVDL